jgi:hypothetical protein
LKKYDKQIYRIQTFREGRLVKTNGRLSDKYIRDGLVSEVAKHAKATKFTGWALQAGVVQEKALGSSSSTHPTPTGSEGKSSSTHPTPSAMGGVREGAGSSTHPSPSASPSASPDDGAGSSTYPSPSASPSASAGSSTVRSPNDGAGSSTHPSPSASPSASAGSSTVKKGAVTSSTKKLVDESKEMLEKIRPILEKYNKD